MTAAIRNLTTQAVLADQAESAEGLLKRMTGLLSRRSLGAGEGLILPRCSAIHTCFMRFPIDVLFLKTASSSKLQASSQSRQPAACSLQPETGVVVKVVEHLKPFRLAWARGADTVVELPAGTISRTATQAGELLEIARDITDPAR